MEQSRPPRPGNEAILLAIFTALHAQYGPQHWWPAITGSRWEIMMGAVLTQRTSWRNVDRALANILAAWGVEGLSDPVRVLRASHEELVELIRPAGHFRSKPRRLKLLAEFIVKHGGVDNLAASDETTDTLRDKLLAVWGVGPETADAILLYALQRTTFVADAYALRLASRWGLISPDAGYYEIQRLFTDNLPHDLALFNEYHALIVEHGKQLCRPRPLCHSCLLYRSLTLEMAEEGSHQVWRCPKMHIIKERK